MWADWRSLHLQEWAADQGIHLHLRHPAERAAKWLVHQLRKRVSQPTCVMCRQKSLTCMPCVDCGNPYCAPCLRLEPSCFWDISFCCPPCIVAGLPTIQLDSFSPQAGSPYLLNLALETLQSSSNSLALSTWRNYAGSVQKAITFTHEYGVLCFPVLNDKLADGCMIFFQHLRAAGASWGTLRGVRSAFRSFHKALGWPDPWTSFPRLAVMTKGLQKQTSLPPVQKAGLTIQMLKGILDYSDAEIKLARGRREYMLADILLRDAVAILVAFFAMRRSDEIFMNKEHTHGLLQKHVQLHCPSHVSIFVQAQKTDSYHKGHFVILSWLSGSGVPIGGWLQRLFLRLDECGRRASDAPLFLPTQGNHGFKKVVRGQQVSKPDAFKRLLPRVFQLFRDHPHLLALFNWHSCRRGGATHGYWQNVSLALLAPHGGWNTEEGLKAYAAASFAQRLSVTQRM
jgi:hypothetical protein